MNLGYGLIEIFLFTIFLAKKYPVPKFLNRTIAKLYLGTLWRKVLLAE